MGASRVIPSDNGKLTELSLLFQKFFCYAKANKRNPYILDVDRSIPVPVAFKSHSQRVHCKNEMQQININKSHGNTDVRIRSTKPIHNRRHYQWLIPIISQRNEPLHTLQHLIVVKFKPCTSKVRRYRLLLMKLSATSQRFRGSFNVAASHRDDRI